MSQVDQNMQHTHTQKDNFQQTRIGVNKIYRIDRLLKL